MKVQPAQAIEQLKRAAEAFPQLRLCQLIVNATGRSDPFYVPDDHLADCLRDYRLAHASENSGE